MKRREQAAKAYVTGDANPLGELAATDDPATFFSPGGDFVEGAKAVAARYSKDADSFGAGSETHFEIMHSASDGNLAYWVGLQKASAKMKGKDEPISFNICVTELFRRDENGEWKMIHRHASILKQENE